MEQGSLVGVQYSGKQHRLLIFLPDICHVLQGPGLDVDFISHNARTAKRAPRRHSRSLQVLAQVLEQQRQAQEHYNTTQKGQVPQ